VGVLFGGAVLASFLAGMVALFAPCCISVMLPAYFASSFATRRALVAMTFVFAAGLSLVILPIALGAAALGGFVTTHHFVVYLAGGLLMVALGVYMVAGGKLSLPMPGMRTSCARSPRRMAGTSSSTFIPERIFRARAGPTPEAEMSISKKCFSRALRKP